MPRTDSKNPTRRISATFPRPPEASSGPLSASPASRAAPRPRPILLFVSLAVSLGVSSWLALSPTRAVAQVTSTSDADPAPPGSVRAEIDAAGPGANIEFQLGSSSSETAVIELRTLLEFDDSITLDNADPGFASATLGAPDDGNFLEIRDGVSLTLRDVGLSTNGQNNSDDIVLDTATSNLTLDYDRGEQTIVNDITGLGSITKTGSSALTLGGFNDFAGGLTIREGDVIGDGLAFQTSFIDLAADGSGTTARLVYDFSGIDFLDAAGPMITNSSTNGGIAQFVKRGEGSLDLSGASVAGTIGVFIEEGDVIVDDVFLSNNHDISLSADTQMSIEAAGAPPFVYTGTTSGPGNIATDVTVMTWTGDLSAFTGRIDASATNSVLSLVTIDPAAAPSGALDFDIGVASGATVALNDDFGMTFTGDVSGTGDFSKTGSGTTEWTGTSTGTHRTIISSGTLIGNTGNLRGTITVGNNATVGFRQTVDGTFTGTLSGGAQPIEVLKLSGGRLTLAGDQTFDGTLRVMEGGLHFAQGVDLMTANLAIGTGAGPRKMLTAAYDASPGADNTVDIGGNLTIASDAQVTVDIDDSGASNVRYAAGGVLSIDPTAELVVRLQPGQYASAAPFDILTGSSVAGGSAFTIRQDLFLFDIAGSTSATAYQIALNPNGNSFQDAGTNSNQRSVGGQLDTLIGAGSTGDPQIDSIQDSLTVATDSEVPGILDGVSPDDLAASSNTSLAAAARTWRSLSNRLSLHRNRSIGHQNTREGRRAKARRDRTERLRDSRRRSRPPSVEAGASEDSAALSTEPARAPWVAWVEGSGSIGEIDSSDAKGYDYHLVGPLVGADTALTEQVRAGFALGYTYSDYETNGQQKSEGEANAIETVAYASWLGAPVEALIAARYAHSWVETDRRITIASTTSSIDADYEGDAFGIYAEVTRGFDLPFEIDLAPLASLAYTHVMWDSFDESGTSPLRMRVDDADVDSALTSIGFRIATVREMDDGILFRPRFKAAWNHEWADVEREISGSFASAPTTGAGSFSVEGAEIPRDHAEISAGWEIGYRANANLFIDWDGRFGEDLIENSISVGARVEW
jgi:autotransporter-associated beta strand protein